MHVFDVSGDKSSLLLSVVFKDISFASPPPLLLTRNPRI